MEDVFWGLMIPLLGTTLGAACVFFMRGRLHRSVQRGLTGFASGVMVAASFFSLLLPALEQSAPMGAVGVPSRGDRFRCGCGISSVFGSHYSSSAHERGNGGRAEEPPEEDDDAHFGGDAP